MPALRYVALISTALLAPAASADNFSACVAMVEDTMRETYKPDLRDKRFNREQIDAAFRWVMAGLYLECARRACKADVRECRKVTEFEELERRMQLRLQALQTRPSG